MTRQTNDLFIETVGAIHNLTAHRRSRTQSGVNSVDQVTAIVEHFRAQHESLAAQNS